MIRHGQADIMKTLKARMEDAAERLDFERAASAVWNAFHASP